MISTHLKRVIVSGALLFPLIISACAEGDVEADAGVVAVNQDNTVYNGEWMTWGGDPSFQRFSPLKQINADTVDDLKIVWRWQAPPWETRPDINMKGTPIYVDGMLYVPAGVNQVVALNPSTGETVWVYDPDPQVIKGRSEAISSRAVGYWTDGEQKRLFHNTRDGRLLSIDAETGKADVAFGDNGTVLLREKLRPDDAEVPFVGSSSPPAIVGDVVVAQVVADITSKDKEATPGHIRGFDVRTGELLWTFHTIPQPGEYGHETWEDESWSYTGNTGVWSMMSVDTERGYVYLPIEAPSHDFYGGQRKGDNLFSQSIVCLNGATGERVWHFQMVHHGLWDYDPPAAPILHDIVIDGETIPAVTQVTKQGMSFVFNRETGAPIWPIEERPVPQSTVPGERTSPTQPFPTLPEHYLPLGYSEDRLIDFTPELKAEALAIAENYVRGPMYTPPSTVTEDGTKGTWVEPSYGGGSNWNGGAFDPVSGQMFVPNRNSAFVAGLGIPDEDKTNWDYLRLPTGRVPGPQGLPILKPPYSFVTATDMNTGHHTWSMPIGGAPNWIREHEALQGLDLDFDAMGQIDIRPSPLVTGDLVFLAESGNLFGDPGGPLLRAYDKNSGNVVHAFELPERTSNAPMTYLHDGRQFIVISVASAEHPSELVALSLPDEGDPSGDVVPHAWTHNALAPQNASMEHSAYEPDDIRAGQEIYLTACSACHGDNGEGREGGAPNIQAMRDLEMIKTRVVDGGVGMPAMNSILTEAEVDQVSKFVAIGLPDTP